MQQRPDTKYEGRVVFADGSQLSLQCYEDRVAECPGVLDNGYLCEGPCPECLEEDMTTPAARPAEPGETGDLADLTGRNN